MCTLTNYLNSFIKLSQFRICKVSDHFMAHKYRNVVHCPVVPNKTTNILRYKTHYHATEKKPVSILSRIRVMHFRKAFFVQFVDQ